MLLGVEKVRGYAELLFTHEQNVRKLARQMEKMDLKRNK